MNNASERARKMSPLPRMLLGWSLAAVLLMGSTEGVAQDQSGWAALSHMLGGGNTFDRERAYFEGLQIGAAREAAIEQARTANYVTEIRAGLSRCWSANGFSPSDASALAAAYEPAASESAVIAGVRRKGARSAGSDIRKAIDDNNYLLANQLLLAFAVVSAEEAQTSEQNQRLEGEARMEAARAEAARTYKERAGTDEQAEARPTEAVAGEDGERRQAQRQVDLDASTLSPQQRREFAFDE